MKGHSPRHRAIRPSDYRAIELFLAITALAFIPKLPSALAYFRLCPDALAYLDIARSLTSGGGFTSSLKLNCLDSSAITHSALSDWPPLYPLLAGGLLRLGFTEPALQAANALLVSISAGLVFLISEKIFDRRSALIAGVSAALAPNLFRAGITALSDPLGLALALLAVLVALLAEKRIAWWAAAGAIAGVSCMARYPNAVLLLVLAPFSFSRGGNRGALAFLGVFAAAVAPVSAAKWMLYGSPVYSVQLFHYAAPSFRHVTWGGAIDSAFALHNLAPVTWEAVRSALQYAADLFGGPRCLFLLSAGLPLLLARQSQAVMTADRRVVLWIAALNFAVYALTWSIPPVRGSRFMLLSYCLLLPFCAAGLARAFVQRRIVRWTAAAVCGGVVCAYCWGCITAASYTGSQFHPPDQKLLWRLQSTLPPGTNVASNNPWIVNYVTALPTAVLPCSLDRESLSRYLRRYDIRAIVVFGAGRQSQTIATIRRNPRDFHLTRLGPKAFAAVPIPTTQQRLRPERV